MTWTKRDGSASYNFVAPEIEEDEGKKIEVVFPTNEQKTVTLESNAAEVKVKRTLTMLDLGSAALGANATLTTVPDSNLPVGARVIVTWTSDSSARSITIKTDESNTACTLTGTASTKVTKELIWNGSTFLSL